MGSFNALETSWFTLLQEARHRWHESSSPSSAGSVDIFEGVDEPLNVYVVVQNSRLAILMQGHQRQQQHNTQRTAGEPDEKFLQNSGLAEVSEAFQQVLPRSIKLESYEATVIGKNGGWASIPSVS